MRKESSASSTSLGYLIILALLLFLPAIVMRAGDVARVIDIEHRLYTVMLGEASAVDIRSRASQSYLETMAPFDPREPVDATTTPAFLKERADTVRHLLYLLLYRLSFLQTWGVLAAAFILMSMVDGQLVRRARMWDFSFVSPQRQRVNRSLVLGCLAGLVCVLVVPLPLPPILLPLLIIALGLSIQKQGANMQKRS